MKTLFDVTAAASGGRNGHVHTADGCLDLQLVLPKEMGGDGSAGPNPETLFAAGYAACFDSALNNIAGRQNIKLSGDKVEATVALLALGVNSFGLGVRLEVHLPDLPGDVAQQLVDMAHEMCPYSKAVRGNIPVEVVLVS